MANCDMDQICSNYTSIKIIPSLEDTLRSMGLDLTLEDNLVMWLDKLKITWLTYKKNPVVETYIDALFHSRYDAFKVALIFVVKSPEYKDCKPKSLPYFIIEVLLKYSMANNVFPEEELKMPAYQIAIQQRNQHFLNLVVKTYQLCTIKQQIVPSVEAMLKNDNCRQASQIVIAMELFDEIPVQDLLFPLILQDKSNMIDEYLTQCPTQVLPFVLFMDTLLDKNFYLLDFVQNYVADHNIHNIKTDKLHYKPLGKLVARLCNKFNVPIETCKNLSKNRTASGLRYLVYQKYVERKVSSSVWDDLVKDSLRQSSDSAYDFISLLVDYDKTEAMKWAKHLNIPQNELPLALRGDIPIEPVVVEENWDVKPTSNPKDFYESTLKKDQIEIIDSGEKFYDLMSSLSNHSIVSLDCEWKPSFGAKQSQIALIQLGTLDKVYIIDTIVLNNQSYASFWHSFYKSFLDNAETIKLGFGLEQDLKEMKAIVSLSNIKVKGEGYLDISVLWKSLLSNGLSLPGNSDSGASLSSLVQTCFGKPLEKSEQCSNWELRPLRDTQIEYAAIDAHVLVKIYYYLQNKCQEQNINFEEICNDVMVESKKKVTKKAKVVDRVQQSFLPVFEVKSVKDIKFFVDPVLENIVHYLRYCGIDCLPLPTTLLWHDVIYQAISDDRFVILSKPKNTPNTKYPQSSIISVGKCPVLEQMHKILNRYNIEVLATNFMTVCIYCNGKSLNKLSPTEVVQLCSDFEAARCRVNILNRYVQEDDEEIDFGNFLSDSEHDEDYPPRIPANNKSCLTKKGTQVVIDNPNQLSNSEKSAFLCDDCGKLYSEDDDLLKIVIQTVSKVTNLTPPT